ncbi:MAG: zinc-dependent alcohol dehydrogenase family protein [Calditrichaeota bacterium]|nr:zinc-dependent alcohol dehydrogenase family protein [Calditrichota bacterium]
MLAQRLKKPKPVEQRPLALEEIPTPEPAAGQVRIRVHVCGVCRTDLHLVEGEIATPKLPITPGHQVVGVVEKLGEGVTDWRMGERVGVPWLGGTCGHCHYCQHERENLCDNATFTGQHGDGGFAEYVVVRSDFAHRLPEGFDDLSAAPLLCAGVIGYRALKLADVPKGGKVGLIGFGASAHVTLQVARFLGAEVFVISRSTHHQEHARRLGAVWAGSAEERVPAELDSVVVFAPAGHTIPKALKAVRKGGTVSCAGITMSPIPEMDYSTMYHERKLITTANSTRADVRELLDLACRIPIRPDIESFAFSEANEALWRIKRGDLTGSAVLKILRAA